VQLQCSELLQSPASECVAALFAQARSSRLQFTTLEKFSEAFLSLAAWSSQQRVEVLLNVETSVTAQRHDHVAHQSLCVAIINCHPAVSGKLQET